MKRGQVAVFKKKERVRVARKVERIGNTWWINHTRSLQPAELFPSCFEVFLGLTEVGNVKLSVPGQPHALRCILQTISQLLGPKPFPLDRLMAIFYSIVEGRVAPTANIFSQVRYVYCCWCWHTWHGAGISFGASHRPGAVSVLIGSCTWQVKMVMTVHAAIPLLWSAARNVISACFECLWEPRAPAPVHAAIPLLRSAARNVISACFECLWEPRAPAPLLEWSSLMVWPGALLMHTRWHCVVLVLLTHVSVSNGFYCVEV